MAFFDYCGATIDASAEELGEGLMALLPDAHGFEAGRGSKNYTASMKIRRADGDVVATVLHGGQNGAPHAYASGANAPAFVKAVRDAWPDRHRVTRLDSAEDLLGDFAPMLETCQAIAAGAGIKGKHTYEDGADAGRTYYMGARTSPVFGRLYEKGKELRSKVADPSLIPPDLVRFEIEWKPVREGRVIAAKIEPDQVFGVSAWARDAAGMLFGANPDRFVSQTRLLTDDERSYRAMLRQHGRTLLRAFARAGSAEQLGRNLISDLEGFHRD